MIYTGIIQKIRKRFNKQLLFVSGLLFTMLVQAQQPVQTTVQMIPPYSVTLSDYATANSDRVIVNLLLGDVSEFNRQVVLKLYVEGNGISVRSADVVMGVSPISLDGGVPRRLTNIDLRPYFQLENLVGITPVQYSRPLSAGLYRFCFEAYDYLTGRLLSPPSCAIAYIVLNDPPILNLPVRNENITIKDPQNIIFNWTPRHINATNIQYEFTLAEIWDTNIDPQAAFLASRPLYQTTTRSTTLLYGPAETALLPDKTYAWRVRAIAVDGISELSLFKNAGYSEVYHFNYTKQCTAPQFVLAESTSHSAAKVYWQGIEHLKYQVQYRKKEGNNSGWFEVNAYNEHTRILGLEENTTYEYRVGGQCGYNGGYTFSRIFEFTTGIRGEDQEFTCGVTPKEHIANQEPLPFIGVNETFTAGEFPVTVKRVDGSDGYFTGWGYITVPYLADTRIKIGFENIKVNTDYELVDGILVTDYDPSWGGLDDIQDEIDAVIAIGEWIETFDDAIVTLINNIKEGIDTNIQTNTYINQIQEILDDPDNGLSEEQIAAQQVFIDDKDKIKEAIKQVKEDFASGKNDDVIKENLASNFAGNENTATEDIASAETSFDITEQFESLQKESNTNTVVYLSPAGVPVKLSKEATPRFLQHNSLKVARGVLSSFVLDNETYLGYFAEGKFRGYKKEKGGHPYQFDPIPDAGVVEVVIGLKTPYLECDIIFLKGAYNAKDKNDTGAGILLTNTQISFVGVAKGLSELSANYNTCLPDISRVSYDNFITGYHNFFGNNGFLRIVRNKTGGISYIYAVTGTEGDPDFYQYNPNTKKWSVFTVPPVSCTSCDLKKMFAALYDPSGIGHFVLDAAGMVPLFGEAFDVINGIWYTIEGDGENAIISFASTIPLVYATTAKYIGKIVKLSDGSYTIIKFGDQASAAFLENVKRIDLDAEGLKVLNEDLANKDFAEAIIKNPDLIDAWKILNDADSPLKTNVDELRDVSKYLDNVDNFGSYNNWKLRTGRTKHPNWTQVDNVASKIQGRLSHVDYLDFKGNGFEGCHTQNAMNQFLNDNPGWTGGFIDRNGNPVNLLDNSVVEAYPWVKNTNGNIFTKLNGAQNNINGVQYGKASFFPKNWDTTKLKREVEHAISNNHGLVSGNTYKGYSTDGTIEINFYYNISTGRIISFFPKKL
ncbi:EndoU domain-containing protein [Aquimarina sp. 2201CG1-2-11]|uniref:EndoU domain-containing protein n=1 Tax=Aquimarina discodermiae TaxID=3231043 RepID=UPI003461CB93